MWWNRQHISAGKNVIVLDFKEAFGLTPPLRFILFLWIKHMGLNVSPKCKIREWRHQNMHLMWALWHETNSVYVLQYKWTQTHLVKSSHMKFAACFIPFYQITLSLPLSSGLYQHYFKTKTNQSRCEVLTCQMNPLTSSTLHHIKTQSCSYSLWK